MRLVDNMIKIILFIILLIVATDIFVGTVDTMTWLLGFLSFISIVLLWQEEAESEDKLDKG